MKHMITIVTTAGTEERGLIPGGAVSVKHT